MAGSTHFPKQNEALWANLSFASSGDNTVVSGVASQTITIVKLALGVAAGTSVTATLYDGPSSTGTAKGSYFLGSTVLDLETDPIIIAAGDNFVINLSGAVAVKGSIAYVQGPVVG